MTEELLAAPPRDGYRAMSWPAEFRADDGPPRLVGHFARFGVFNEIDSAIEGRFMERIDAGAFTRTFKNNRDRIRVLLQHGKDPAVGEKPIATITELRSDSTGPYYEAELLDGIDPLVVDGLRKGQYGVSYRFQVEREDWDPKPTRSPANPKGLPERTIREAKVFEFGPVTFPADAGADIAVRSLSDQFSSPVAPSDEPEVVPHPVAEARDEPDPPLRIVQGPDAVVIAAIDLPAGGSSNTRSATVEYESIEDVQARFTELNETIARLADTFPLPEAEQVTFDASVDERNQLGKQIDRWEANQAAVIRAAANPANLERPFDPNKGINPIIRKDKAALHSPESRATTLEGRVAEFRDDAKRILDDTAFPQNLTKRSESGDRITDLLDHHDSADGELARRIKYTSSPVYLRAFEKIIKARGSTIGLTPEEQRGTALAVGVDATGGFTVPFAFDPTVIAIGVWTGSVNPYRRACRVVPIVGTDTWNALTSTVVTATRTTESAVTIEQGPTFAQPQYVVTRVQGQITASFEMFQDRVDLASELSGLIQEAKDNEEESSMATGATAAANIGVGPVSGTSGCYTAVAGGGSGVIAALDANLTEAALPVRHRFNAQWFMNRANIRKFQAVETAGGILFGGSSYQSVGNVNTSRDGNTGLRLLGYPVNESPSLPVATTTTITIGPLMDVSSYVIVDRIGMSVQFIPFIFGASQGNLVTGQQALYFMYRNTAKPLNVDAGRILRFV